MSHTTSKKQMKCLGKETSKQKQIQEQKQEQEDKRNELIARFNLKSAKIKHHELKIKIKQYKKNNMMLLWSNERKRQLYQDTITRFEHQYSHRKQIVKECKVELHNAKFAKEIRQEQKDDNDIILYKNKIVKMRKNDLEEHTDVLHNIELQINATTNILDQIHKQLSVLKDQRSGIYDHRKRIKDTTERHYLKLYRSGKNNIYDCLKLPNSLKDIVVEYTFA